MTRTTTVLSLKCAICGEPGMLRSIELLPKSGIAMECIHGNGVKHEWAEYDSMRSLIKQHEPKMSPPNLIKCPKCDKKGRVNSYHPDKSRPDVVEYLVVHEKIKGTWGKTKMNRRRRCYITNLQQRDDVLKKLGRYIQKNAKLNGWSSK